MECARRRGGGFVKRRGGRASRRKGSQSRVWGCPGAQRHGDLPSPLPVPRLSLPEGEGPLGGDHGADQEPLLCGGPDLEHQRGEHAGQCPGDGSAAAARGVRARRAASFSSPRAVCGRAEVGRRGARVGGSPQTRSRRPTWPLFPPLPR